MTHAAPKPQTAYSDCKHCGARRLRPWLHSTIGPVTACGGRAAKAHEGTGESAVKAQGYESTAKRGMPLGTHLAKKRSTKVTYPKTRVKRSSGIHSERHVT